VFGASERTPQALVGVGHETENQFARHETPHQPLGILKVPLATAWRAIGMRLRQMQLALLFESPPHRLPVKCSGFHYYFADAPFAEPGGEFVQIGSQRAELASLKAKLAFGGVRDHHCQHALVYVNSGYPIRFVHIRSSRRNR